MDGEKTLNMRTYCDKEGGCYVCGALMCDGTPRKILKEKERKTMGEYGPGLTFGQCCMMDKERIIHAFRGELMICEEIGKDGEGHFVYAPASKDDCLDYILSAYDNAVYHAKEAMDSGRALERLFEEVAGEKTTAYFRRYVAYSEEECRRYQNDYHFESDEPDLKVIRGGNENQK